MMIVLPELRVGEPLCYESLSVFPLFAERSENVEYRLSVDALADESILIEEVGEGGSVPELSVENKGDTRVLFLEGEELVGAKQNRILNTSVLVAAHSKIKIPVSCVEQGRWAHKSRYFGSSGSHSPSRLRGTLRESVSRSVRENRGYGSDQGRVWREVASLHATHEVESTTAAMSDAFEKYQGRIAAYKANLPYVDGAAGFAAAIADRIVLVDVFDKAATCEKVWDRLLSGVVFDALEVGESNLRASVSDVEQYLAAASELPWTESEAVGEGEEYRAETPRGDHAAVLTHAKTVVHSSVVASAQ